MLNKADQVDSQRLMRVFGALMWALSRILRQPEVPFHPCFFSLIFWFFLCCCGRGLAHNRLL